MVAEEVTCRLLYVCARTNDGAFARAEIFVVYEGHWDVGGGGCHNIIISASFVQ